MVRTYSIATVFLPNTSALPQMCISAAIRQFEAKFGRTIRADAGPALEELWQHTLVQPRESSLTTQSWLWAPPTKHSTRQIGELLERIEVLYQLGVQHHLQDHPDDLLRRYARRLVSRLPSAGRLTGEPGRTIEVACFMRYSLQTNTDRLLLMVRRRVADLWRRTTKDANRILIHWADMYRELLASVGALASDTTIADGEIRPRRTFVAASAVLMTRRSKQAWPDEIQPCPKCDILG